MPTIQGVLESVRVVRRFVDWDHRPSSWQILNPRDSGQQYGIALVMTWIDTKGHPFEFVGLLGSPTHLPAGQPTSPFPLLRMSLDDTLAEAFWLELWPDGDGGVRAAIASDSLGKPIDVDITDGTDGDVLVR
ncbi:hypothetical protein GR927_20635 [Mycolicibacterium sp. 3033]|nr:hypothetical protein [Mycolicibacterium aurantiacum]